MIRIFRVTQSVLSLLGLAALLACGGGGGGDNNNNTPTSSITSVSVSPGSASINLNDAGAHTASFSASVAGTGSYASTVTWSGSGAAYLSSTTANAVTFTATAVGSYTITATSTQDSSKSSSATITVTKPLADTLSYTNPSSGTYTLVKNTAKSTATHLVLDLLGPAGSVSGVGFYLSADPATVTWSTVDAGDPEKIKSATFSNTLVKSKVSSGTLQGGVYQKGTAAAVGATTSTVLASVALDLVAGRPSNTAANLAAPAGKAVILNAPGGGPATTAITITVGTLVAN